MPGGSAAFDLPDDPPVHELEPGTITFRIHGKGNGPIWFNPKPGDPPSYRFDAPASEFRTLYAAQHIEGSFAETVLRKKGRIVGRGEIESRAWSVIEVRRRLLLAKAHGEGLRQLDVDSRISSTLDYSESRAFALAIFNAYPKLDGIAYRSRVNDGEVCYAIFDRVQPKDLNVVGTMDFIDDWAAAESLVREAGAAIDLSPPLPGA